MCLRKNFALHDVQLHGKELRVCQFAATTITSFCTAVEGKRKRKRKRREREREEKEKKGKRKREREREKERERKEKATDREQPAYSHISLMEPSASYCASIFRLHCSPCSWRRARNKSICQLARRACNSTENCSRECLQGTYGMHLLAKALVDNSFSWRNQGQVRFFSERQRLHELPRLQTRNLGCHVGPLRP